MKNNSPDWSKSAQWNEYDWEIAMRSSDDFASKYFHLLNQYGDFPGAEDYILSKLDETACPPSPSSAEDYEIEEFFDSQSSDEEENDENEEMNLLELDDNDLLDDEDDDDDGEVMVWWWKSGWQSLQVHLYKLYSVLNAYIY